MKLLMESTDRALLLEKAALLQSKGIPVHLDEVPYVGAVPSHLYVLLHKHLEDAQFLMNDAEHPVREPVYSEDLEILVDNARKAAAEMRDTILERLALGILVLMSVIYVAARVFD